MKDGDCAVSRVRASERKAWFGNRDKLQLTANTVDLPLLNNWLTNSGFNSATDHTLFSVTHLAATAAKSLQSCPTLCNPIDGSPPGSPIPGILQARTMGWVAISFSNAWKWKVKGKSLSRVQLFVTPQTAAYPAPLSMGFSRQEYWSGVPLPSPAQRYNINQLKSVGSEMTSLIPGNLNLWSVS